MVVGRAADPPPAQDGLLRHAGDVGQLLQPEHLRQRPHGHRGRRVARLVDALDGVDVLQAVLDRGVAERLTRAAEDDLRRRRPGAARHAADDRRVRVRGRLPGEAVGAVGRGHDDVREHRRGGVVPEREGRAAGVARAVAAAAADGGVVAVGAAVARRRAGVDPGGAVGAGEADRDGMVVPAVRVRGARGRRGHGRGRRVVPEPERARPHVACEVAAAARDRRRLPVGSAVGRRSAGLDAGERVAAAERVADRVVVPAVRVRRTIRRRRGHRRGRLVDPDVDRLGRRAGAVRHRTAGRSAGGLRREDLRAAAAQTSGSRDRPGDGDIGPIPVVAADRARDGEADDRQRLT